MPSRSLQRLPPRSPPDRRDRSAPCRARLLAGRTGSQHRHPLPDMHDNKAEHPAENPRCLPAAGRQQNLSERLPRPPLHYAEPGSGPDAVRRQVIQIAAGCARTRRRPLSFPGSHTHVLWVSRSRVAGFRSRRGLDLAGPRLVSDLGEQARRSVTAAPVPPRPIPGCRGRHPAPALRPRGPARGHGQPDRPRLRAGWPSRRPRAGSPLMTSPGPRGNRAAPVVTPAPGEPWTARSACVTGSRAGAGHAPPAEPGKFQLPGSSQAHGFRSPRVPRQAGHKQAASAPPWRGAACTTKRSRWRRAL